MKDKEIFDNHFFCYRTTELVIMVMMGTMVKTTTTTTTTATKFYWKFQGQALIFYGT